MRDRREDLALLVLMLCGLAAMLHASGFDGVAFDPFSFQQDGLAAPEVDVGWGEVTYALVVPGMIVVGDEVTDLLLGISGQVVVLEQDPVLERLVPALDLSLRLGMKRGTPDMVHALLLTPVCQVTGDVGRAVIAQQPRSVCNVHAIEA